MHMQLDMPDLSLRKGVGRCAHAFRSLDDVWGTKNTKDIPLDECANLSTRGWTWLRGEEGCDLEYLSSAARSLPGKKGG